jgi:DNA-binding IclR family transcriptional regulator
MPEASLKSLSKVVSVLDAFSTSRRSLSLAEISAATGFPRSTAHRLAASMRHVGLLEQDGHRDRYRLGLKLFELGNTMLANMDLHREALPFVDALSRVSGHQAHLAVFDGRQVIFIHRVSADSNGSPVTLIESAPAHCTSVGKAILAFQPAATIDSVIARGLERITDTTITDGRKLKADLKVVRSRGYAVTDGEHHPGVRCIGAPVHDGSGDVVAGLSISGPTRRLRKDQVAELAKIVVHHARMVGAKL